MACVPKGNTVVFVGPSLSSADVLAILPSATIRPAAQRGDICRARDEGASVILLIDGVFAHRLAVSPREIVDVLKDGATVVGASSMGAIRAAECHPAGMIGVGLIYRLFRASRFYGDDEVAVATDPRDGAAQSIALVNVRYALLKALKTQLVSRATVGRVCKCAEDMYFPDRTWPAILEGAGVSDPDGRLLAFCRAIDLKRDDAFRATRRVGSLAPPVNLTNATVTIRATASDKRYPGHDRRYGQSKDALKMALCEWLVGSGRYQQYVWALVVGEPDFAKLTNDPTERAYQCRERLIAVLRRHLTRPDEFADRLWSELEYLDELDTELLVWHAVRTLSQANRHDEIESPPQLARVREEIARWHGMSHWLELQSEVIDEHLYGAIPFVWVQAACLELARARTLSGARSG